MRDAILEYLKAEGDASLFAMERDIPGFSGTATLTYNGDPNQVVWPSVSEAALDALTDLISVKAVTLNVEPELIYKFDGASVPNLPRSDGVRRVRVKSWVPCVCRYNGG
ncbi:hypothetical protein SAMN05421647_102237 [Marinobacterium stanieri]|uniref:Uncharacterized protein n=1 Tax=Marinobacterium stanieri TaxID=49186 RepID=A0A1N6Q415_9GAMM|nr:hypothetical protein SAMN05421647_102237 [Marinobacterium stanieri]